MSNLYTRIESLCADRGVNITTMCKESGASRASLSDLKVGRKQRLSADTLSKIASYFEVSVDYLLGRTDDPIDYDNDAEAVAEVPISYVEACEGDVQKARALMAAVDEDAAFELDAPYRANLARKGLERCKELDPNMRSIKRIMIITEPFYDEFWDWIRHSSITEREIYDWIDHGIFPRASVVRAIAKFLGLSPEELLTPEDYIEMLKRTGHVRLYDPTLVKRRNIIKIAGRDGSYRERHLTDEQLAAFNAMLDALPDASDDI